MATKYTQRRAKALESNGHAVLGLGLLGGLFVAASAAGAGQMLPALWYATAAVVVLLATAVLCYWGAGTVEATALENHAEATERALHSVNRP